MKQRQWILANTLVLFCAFSLAAATKSPSADVPQSTTSLSHIRVVRISFVQGDVFLRRDPSATWASAMLNTPIQEGFSVETGTNGYAEIEFENGSTARLGENAQLDFTQLALTAEGDKLNVLALTKGFGTFHLTPQHHDEYTVNASGISLQPKGKAEFRADLSDAQLRVEVFEGDVRAEKAGKAEQLGKNKVLTYALSGNGNTDGVGQISSGLQKDAWDKWTQARDQQAMLATNDEGVSPSSATFGWADLGTYGAWGYFPGYGYGWAPYEPAGWMPYSAGMWSYYPGWGYTWISGEPWGWLPFHNGFWNYDQSMGWFWMPGQAGVWSPALVNWYQGPGWVGWTPLGPGGRAVCATAGAGCITAITPVALQNGQRVQPGSTSSIHPASLVGAYHVAQPAVAPIRGATPSGQSTSVALGAARVANVGQSAFVRTAAPSSVVIGRSVSADQFLGRHGFLGGPQAIHAPLGRTMGGVFPTVAGSHGALMPSPSFRGPATTGGGPAAFRSPTMITRGSFARTESGQFVALGGQAGGPASLGSSAGVPGGAGRAAAGVSRGAVGGRAGGGPSAGGGHR